MRRKLIEALQQGMLSVRDRVENDQAVFDLDSWGRTDEPCGFAGCLLGWAAHEQWLKPHGVDLTLYVGEYFGERFVEPALNGKRMSDYAGGTDCTLAKLFDVDPLTIQMLIYSENYGETPFVTPDMVIERLDVLLHCGNDGFLQFYAEEIDRDWR